MSDLVRYSLVALVILVTTFQQGVTGFGCTVLALPFVVLLVGVKTAVPVLVIQAWVLSLGVVVEGRRKIAWTELGKIVGLVAIGLPFGIWMMKSMPETWLKWLLAFFMVAVGAQGLLATRAALPAAAPVKPRRNWLVAGLLPLGGIIHGAFGSGGPLIVVYAARALPDKGLFRVTLCVLWLVLNTVLISQWVVSRSLDAHILRLAAICLPFTLLGLVVGSLAHYRINEVAFRRLVYGVLIAAGAVLVWSLV